jgi:ABC-type transport system substrate-binding protein
MGGFTMQKLVVSGLILMLVTLGWSDSGRGEHPPAPRGELRIVDQNPRNWISITLNVIEELMTLDQEGNLVPRLATRWQWLNDRTLDVTLRQGVTFHNGEVFDAAIVQLNYDETFRFRQPHRNGTYMNFTPGSRLEILDPHTVRILFPEPDGAALVKISNMHMANRQFHRELGWGEKSW